jgi:hypothetical protein
VGGLLLFTVEQEDELEVPLDEFDCWVLSN